MKKYFENDDILSIIYRWRKELGIVFIITLILSVFFSSSLVIKPKYRSFARVYPSNLNSYSEESYSEQMLQLLESDVIRNKLVEEFNLQEHYEIADDDPHKVDRLYKEYNDNVTFTKTKYESVEIEVRDISPEMAYEMLNRLISLYNEQVKIIQDSQLKEAVKTLEKVLKTKEAEMDTLEAQINFLRDKYSLLDYKSQVKNISKEYYKLLARPNGSAERLNKVKKELDQLKSKGSEFERLTDILQGVRTEYTKIKIEYDSQFKELLRDKKYANVIVNGYKSDKKVYPIRCLIVTISLASAMLAAIGVISFMDRVNKITE